MRKGHHGKYHHHDDHKKHHGHHGGHGRKKLMEEFMKNPETAKKMEEFKKHRAEFREELLKVVAATNPEAKKVIEKFLADRENFAAQRKKHFETMKGAGHICKHNKGDGSKCKGGITPSKTSATMEDNSWSLPVKVDALGDLDIPTEFSF